MIMVLELLQRSTLMPCNPTKVKKQLSKRIGVLSCDSLGLSDLRLLDDGRQLNAGQDTVTVHRTIYIMFLQPFVYCKLKGSGEKMAF